MMKIEKKHGKKFELNEKMGLFYAIVDAYQNRSSKEHPLTDTEMVDILQDHYGLKVERRTIKRYRDFLCEYFDINLVSYKKGHYIPEPEAKKPSVNPSRTPFEEMMDLLMTSIDAFQNADAEEIDDLQCINVRDNGTLYTILPLEMAKIGNEDYVIACCDKNVLSFRVRDLTLSKRKPFVPMEDSWILNVLYDRVMVDGLARRIIAESAEADPDDIWRGIILSKDAPWKAIWHRVQELSRTCEIDRVKRKGVYHKRIHFYLSDDEYARFKRVYGRYILKEW